MTTIQKKAPRQFVDHATPAERLRHMGETDEYMARKGLSVRAAEWCIGLLAAAIFAWAIWG